MVYLRQRYEQLDLADVSPLLMLMEELISSQNHINHITLTSIQHKVEWQSNTAWGITVTDAYGRLDSMH